MIHCFQQEININMKQNQTLHHYTESIQMSIVRCVGDNWRFVLMLCLTGVVHNPPLRSEYAAKSLAVLIHFFLSSIEENFTGRQSFIDRHTPSWWWAVQEWQECLDCAKHHLLRTDAFKDGRRDRWQHTYAFVLGLSCSNGNKLRQQVAHRETSLARKQTWEFLLSACGKLI